MDKTKGCVFSNHNYDLKKRYEKDYWMDYRIIER